ncbi:MAG: hypothetical protein AUJ82_05010 [Verrucomicrobia bacterium CG1_02_43_26]|nr:MAG: hypothetical protein AUJ82_05010 [Verrucomicrobia bacterium CG1_02_43_26]
MFLPFQKSYSQPPPIDSPNNMGNDGQNCLNNNTLSNFPPVSFLLMRHGQTDWSFDHLERGVQDLDLNEQGIKTVLKTAQTLASRYSSVVIVSSPKLRTIHTARILQAAIGGDIIIKEGIDARYYGDFSKDKNLASAYRNAYFNETNLCLPDDAEADEHFTERVRKSIIQELSNSCYNNMLLIFVTHGEVFHYLTKALIGQEMKIEKGTAYLFLPPTDKVNLNWKVLCQE